MAAVEQCPVCREVGCPFRNIPQAHRPTRLTTSGATPDFTPLHLNFTYFTRGTLR